MERKLPALLIPLALLLFLALVPPVSAGTCGIYIYDLDANENGLITFKINNTGNIKEDISYKVYVGLKEVQSVNNVSLDAGKKADGIASYSFLYGNYKIRVDASADCGSRDTEEMVYALLEPLPEVCSGPEGIEGGRRCDVHSGFVLECRDGQWTYYGEDESCRSECYPYCGGEKPFPGCRVDIESLDFLDRIMEGNALKLETGIKNSGKGMETINLKLYINGALQRDYLLPPLGPGKSRLETLYYYPKAGQNSLLLEAMANCSASDSKAGNLTVIEAPPEPKPEPEPEPQPLVTRVSISPKSLDIPLCKSKTLELGIDSSRSQEFSISVSGADEEWLRYPERVEIEGRNKVYVYITPKKTGTYNLTITVRGENQTFREEASFYAAPAEEEEEAPSDWLSGLSRFLTKNWLAISLAVGIIVLVLVIVFGAEYWREKGRI